MIFCFLLFNHYFTDCVTVFRLFLLNHSAVHFSFSSLTLFFFFLLQRGLLPGHHHWHGSHYEHVHRGAVWRHCHGECTMASLPLAPHPTPPPSPSSVQLDCISVVVVGIRLSNNIHAVIYTGNVAVCLKGLYTQAYQSH